MCRKGLRHAGGLAEQLARVSTLIPPAATCASMNILMQGHVPEEVSVDTDGDGMLWDGLTMLPVSQLGRVWTWARAAAVVRYSCTAP